MGFPTKLALLLFLFVLSGCSEPVSGEPLPNPSSQTKTPPGGDDAGALSDGAGDRIGEVVGDAGIAIASDTGDANRATSDGAAAAGDEGRDSRPLDVMGLDGSESTSIGGPSDGRLVGGVPLPEKAPGIIRNPRRLNPGGHYATVETIQALLRAAAVVEKAMPGGHPIMVNDLCFAEGGPIPHHGSHQSGRDVDVLFSLFDREGTPRPAKGVPLDLRGRGWDFNDLADPEDDLFVKIDAARTWRLLQALVEDEQTELQRVFVAEHLREILMREGRRQKAPLAARRRVGELTCQPGSPHDDHFHFRFFCAPGDIGSGCEDSPPIYHWRRQQLAALKLRPKRYIPRARRRRRRRRRAKTTSRAAAKKQAGRMHWKVIAFLREREGWSEQPHPGRPYCR